jgi:hypothetical protein
VRRLVVVKLGPGINANPESLIKGKGKGLASDL